MDLRREREREREVERANVKMSNALQQFKRKLKASRRIGSLSFFQIVYLAAVHVRAKAIETVASIRWTIDDAISTTLKHIQPIERNRDDMPSLDRKIPCSSDLL